MIPKHVCDSAASSVAEERPLPGVCQKYEAPRKIRHVASACKVSLYKQTFHIPTQNIEQPSEASGNPAGIRPFKRELCNFLGNYCDILGKFERDIYSASSFSSPHTKSV